jgi:poly-gamma-glutamate synthesis protein (capsule biosynthesis protein)
MINISMYYPDYDFIFLGDLFPVDSNVNEKVIIGPKLQNLLSKSKHNVVNLEYPLTKSESKIAKTGPNFKADPSNVNLLRKFNINICNLANNHIKDYGIQGIIDTCSSLESSNIKYFDLMGYNENNLLFIDVYGI